MYQRFRPVGAGAKTAAVEAVPEIADTGATAEDEDGGAITGEGAEGVESTGVGTLTDELLPESISRFSRFKSPRISDATW